MSKGDLAETFVLPMSSAVSTEMNSSFPSSSFWKEIDLAEDYFSLNKFEAAASLTSSVIQRLRGTALEIIEDLELLDIMDSAGLVFVESLKELGRTSEIFKELETLFGSVPAIPSTAFLSGVSAQLSLGLGATVRPIIESFLEAWTFSEGQEYIALNLQSCQSYKLSTFKHPFLSVEDYFIIVDIYTIQTLGTALKDVDLAISWTKASKLPEVKKQELCRKLESLRVVNNPKPSAPPQEKFVKDRHSTKDSDSKLFISKALHPCLWFFSSFYLKCRHATLFLRHGKILKWSMLFFLSCYVLWMKREALRRTVANRALSIRRALLDIWQLAFSVQVNPLAAVQALPASTNGSR